MQHIADGSLITTPICWSMTVMSSLAGDDPAAAMRAWLALYASHALSTWGQRMWEFAVGLFMLQLRPDSLLLVSVYGLVIGGAQVLSGGAVGHYVGRC